MSMMNVSLCVALIVLTAGVSGCGCKKTQPHEAIENGDYRALENALTRGADPDTRNEQQIPLLHYAISKGDAKAVSILLEYGADLAIRDPKGCPAFENALLHILEREGDKWTSIDNPDQRSISVLRDIMCSVRKKSYSQIQIEGRLQVGLSIGGIKDGMFKGRIYVTLRSEGGDYSLHLSEYETDYYGVPRTRGGAVLRSGQPCRVSGWEKEGEIEVTELKFVGEQNEGGQLDVPISYILPSTYSAMMNKAWVRDHDPNDGSDLQSDKESTILP